MKDINIDYPFEIYSHSLKKINNIEFSPREIDVIACLLTGRSIKGIAHFLGISPNTVQAHVRNIMQKMECNSRENIINFIESSNKSLILKQYYLSLLVNASFEQSLKEIAKQINSKGPHCLIVYWQEQETKNTFSHQLKNHLELTGIRVSIEVRVKQQPLSSLIYESDNVDFVMYILPEAEKYKYLRKEKLSPAEAAQKNQRPLNHVLFLRSNQGNATLKNSGMNNFIDFAVQNYYFSFFELLKRILPSSKIVETIFIEFRKKYESMVGSPESTYYNLKEDRLAQEKSFSINNIGKQLKEKKWHVLAASLFIVVIFSLGFFSYLEKTSEMGPLRSAMNLPERTVLLDRSELMSEITNKLKEKQGIQTIALVGIGGSGKTTLARQYAKSERFSVAWEIKADTKESLTSSLENLAYALSKTTEDRKLLQEFQVTKNARDKEERVLFFVREHLKSRPHWLLIYDNIDDIIAIHKYLPDDQETWGQGKVILTTRNSHIQHSSNVNHVVYIGELNPKQKLNLFLNIMAKGENRKLITEQKKEVQLFLKELPSFPLDVSMAAYFIKTTHVPYKKYAEYLNSHNEDFGNIQEKLLRETGDYTTTRQNLLLSLQHLMESNKDFGDLFLFINLLNPQDIPRDLLEACKDSIIVDDFLYNMKTNSLITNESSRPSIGSTFSIHPSLQKHTLDYILTRLNIEKNNPKLQQFSNVLDKHAMDAIQKSNIPKMKILTKHCKAFLSHRDLLTDKMAETIGNRLELLETNLEKYQNPGNTSYEERNDKSRSSIQKS